MNRFIKRSFYYLQFSFEVKFAYQADIWFVADKNLVGVHNCAIGKACLYIDITVRISVYYTLNPLV